MRGKFIEDGRYIPYSARHFNRLLGRDEVLAALLMDIGSFDNMTTIMTILKVSKAELKSKMLSYFRRIERTGKPIVVTDHRQPKLKIIPYFEGESPDTLFSDVRGKVRYHGDLTEPTTEEWRDLD